ncbi:MAG: ArnT family glycosyltransferase [Opitutales bacterium]
MPRVFPRISPALMAFLGAFALAGLFAVYTNHTWEDYYITYRSSKNLATGHGLVFNHGDRLHTFTSPLGVLLPAAAYWLTGNTSDTGALWIFRLGCAAAFGGAVLLLGLTARRQHGTWVAGGLLAAWLATDPKSVDFTINGMETALMLLFLAYALWSQLSTSPRRWLHLGAAWAGLMWTRPDSFIYIALLAGAFWLFHDEKNPETSRSGLWLLYLRAGAVTTLLYLPWLLWAWGYYGTPIPHTITAKGGIGDPHTLAGLLRTAVQLPYLAWARESSLELTFLPSYYMIGGWPSALILLSRGLATLCCLLWLLPFLRSWARAASFAFYGAHVYLTYFPYFPFPWYIPSTTLLALVAFGGLVDWMRTRSPASRRRRTTAWFLAAVLLTGNVWMLSQVARQVRAQQALVEDGTRRKIGEWLHEHAAQGDTVFMEPLGYIGFFSGLKTYDWPGMSSREMVEARQRVGPGWGAILRYLRPNWIVLRPFEIERVNREASGLLTNIYEGVLDFNRTAEVSALPVYGRPYLEHDAHFLVFQRRQSPLHDPSELVLTQSGDRIVPVHADLPPDVFFREFNGHGVSVIGAPARFEFSLGNNQSELIGGFGLLDESWTGTPKTGPVEFTITLHRSDGAETVLLHKSLNPVVQAEDRGFRPFRLSLPQPSAGALRFQTIRTGSTARLAAFWGELKTVSLRTTLDFNGRQLPATAASQARFGFANTEEDGQPCTFAHAPTTLVYDCQSGMNRLQAEFGIIRRAYESDRTAEGVVFLVEIQDAAGRRHELFRRHLNPVQVEADRGAQSLDVPIPSNPGGQLLLHTLPPLSGHLNSAWSYWRNLRVSR